MSEMIERVARAMAERDSMGATEDGPDKPYRHWQSYVPMAEAAIEAMRTPTKDMVEAGDDACGIYRHAEDTWRKMIDAALPEPPK